MTLSTITKRTLVKRRCIGPIHPRILQQLIVASILVRGRKLSTVEERLVELEVDKSVKARID